MTAFQRTRQRSRGLAAWSRAAAKYAAARARDAGAVAVHPEWRERREACRSCPLHVLDLAGVGHCGVPMTRRPLADPLAEPGCGCPVADKARDPAETCHLHVDGDDATCDCPWCRAAGRSVAA